MVLSKLKALTLFQVNMFYAHPGFFALSGIVLKIGLCSTDLSFYCLVASWSVFFLEGSRLVQPAILSRDSEGNAGAVLNSGAVGADACPWEKVVVTLDDLAAALKDDCRTGPRAARWRVVLCGDDVSEESTVVRFLRYRHFLPEPATPDAIPPRGVGIRLGGLEYFQEDDEYNGEWPPHLAPDFVTVVRCLCMTSEQLDRWSCSNPVG